MDQKTADAVEWLTKVLISAGVPGTVAPKAAAKMVREAAAQQGGAT